MASVQARQCHWTTESGNWSEMQTGSVKWPTAAESPPCCFQLRVLATKKLQNSSRANKFMARTEWKQTRSRSAFKNTMSADACQRLSTANQKPGKSAKGNHEENPGDQTRKWQMFALGVLLEMQQEKRQKNVKDQNRAKTAIKCWVLAEITWNRK